MLNEQSAETAEIWRAAQYRRTEDLAKGLSYFLKRSETTPRDTGHRPLELRFAVARGMAIAIVTVVAITSVSAVVHANKSAHVALRATGPMPAVSVP